MARSNSSISSFEFDSRFPVILDCIAGGVAVLCLGLGGYFAVVEGLLSGGLRAIGFRLGLLATGVGLAGTFFAAPSLRRNVTIFGVAGLMTALVIEIGARANAHFGFGRIGTQPPDIAEVALAERSAGIATLTMIRPNDTNVNHSPNRIGSRIFLGGQEVMALSSVGLRRQVYCVPTSGPPVIHTTDRYGFRNVDEIWDRIPASVVVVGDSLVRGTCVRDGETLVDEITSTWPRTVNLGTNGVGPLHGLAVLREYGKLLRPKAVVLVLEVGSDLYEDLAYESKSDILMSYLDRNFSQDIASRSVELNHALENFAEALLRTREARPITGVAANLSILDFWRDRITARFRLAVRKPDTDLYLRILEVAKKDIENWGGRLYVLKLSPPGAAGIEVDLAARIEQIGIDLIRPPIDWHSNGAKTVHYIIPGDGHYSAAGYRLIGSIVTARLRQDGLN